MKTIRPIYCHLIRTMVDALTTELPKVHPSENKTIYQEAINIHKILDLYEKQDPTIQQLINTAS